MTMGAAESPPLAVPFSIRGTLSTGLAVFGRNLLPFLVIAAVVSLPYVLVQTWLDYVVARGDPATSTIRIKLLVVVVQTITTGLLQAAISYSTIQDLRGRRQGIAGAIRGGFARPGEVLFGAMVYGLMLTFATMLFVIPGILVFLSFWVFMPVMVIENRKTSASLRRSSNLTAGRRWRILGLAAVVAMGTFVLAVVLGAAVVLISGETESLTLDVILTLVAVLFSTFMSVVAAVGYYHLRVEKEGVIIDDIAEVFD